MRQLSPIARDLIAALFCIDKPSVWRRLVLSRADDRIDLIGQLAGMGEIAVIPYLRDFLLDDNSDLRTAAAEAIGMLVGRLRSDDYVWLDDQLRKRSAYVMSFDSSESMNPKGIGRLLELRQHAIAAVGLVSCHRSGYVRENAVTILAALGEGGDELPFLLLRCNDWVANVRQAANKAVSERIYASYCEHFLTNILLVDRLASCGRADHSELVDQIGRMLASPETGNSVRRAIQSDDVGVAKASFGLCTREYNPRVDEVVKESLKNRHGVLRLNAMRVAVDRFEASILQPILATLARDQFMPVRRAALATIVVRFPADASGALDLALFDSHPGIRDFARYYLRTSVGDAGIRDKYLDGVRVGNGKRLAAAIAGLGEAGQIEDAELLAPFCKHELTRIRRTALRAVARLASNVHLEFVITALADASAAVSRTAGLILMGRISDVPTPRLREMFGSTPFLHVRKNVVSLLAGKQEWDSLPEILELCTETAGAKYGNQQLETWISQPYTSPIGPEQSRRIVDALDRAEGFISDKCVQTIKFMVRIATIV